MFVRKWKGRLNKRDMKNLFLCWKKCDPNLYSLWTGSWGGRKKIRRINKASRWAQKWRRTRRGVGALSPFRAHREPVRKLQFLQHLVMTPPPPFPKPTPNNKCTFSLTTTISESYLSLFPGHWWWSPQALPELPQAREAGDEPKFDHCRFQSRKCRTVRQDRKTAMRILRSIILPIGFVYYTVKPQRSDILPLCFEEVHSRLCRYQLRQSVTKETEEKETINQVFYSQRSTFSFSFAIHFFISMGCDAKIVLENLHRATRGMSLVYCRLSPFADTHLCGLCQSYLMARAEGSSIDRQL